MDGRFWGAWATLIVSGAALTAVVRRRDRSRERPITGTLWGKYASYFIITAGTLAIGVLPMGLFDLAIGTLGVLILGEIWLAPGIPADAPHEPKQGSPDGSSGPPASESTHTHTHMQTKTGPRLVATPAVLAGIAGALALRRLDPPGNAWGYVWLVVAATDAFSQLFGQGWGRRAMIPRISKGKTGVGFVAGTLTATLTGWFLAPYLGPSLAPRTAARRVGLALATTLAASAGDLLESVLKRKLAIKDFSHLLGPHGGLCDRYDSLVTAAPTLALFLWLGFLR